jgi:tetratricopeptide (TPR) repeat protein
LKALEVRKRLAEKNPQTYETALTASFNNLGVICYYSQRYEEAGEYFLQALEIRKRLAAVNPQVYEPILADSFNNVGAIFQERQCNEEAKKYYLQALEIRKRLNAVNPQIYESKVAGSLQNISFVYLLMKRFSQAEACSREALNYSDTPSIYTNLAAAILLQGRFEEAKEIYLRFKDEKRESFLSDFRKFKEHNIIPEHLMGDVEKIIELLG